MALLLLSFWEVAESSIVDKGERGASTDVGEGSGLLVVRGRGGTFSLPSDGKETLILENLVLNELAKEPRFRRRSSSRFGLALTAFESFLEPVPGPDTVLLVSPLPRCGPAGKDEAVLFALLIEAVLLVLGKLSFLTGMTTPSALRLIRENLGVKAVTDVQFSVGSDEKGGESDEPEVDEWAPGGIDESVM